MPTKTSHGEIRAVAAREFCAKGFHDTRVSGIAAAAGVAQGTFYLYFPSKRQAYFEAVKDLVDKLRAEGAAVDIGPMRTVEDYRDGFVATYTRALEVIAANRDAASLLLSREPVSEEVSALVDGFIDELEAMTAFNIAQGIERGFLRPLDVDVIARAVVGLLRFTIERSVLDEARTDRLGELAAELVDFEIHGAAARPPQEVEDVDPRA